MSQQDIFNLLTWDVFDGNEEMFFLMVIFNTMILFHLIGAIITVLAGTNGWKEEASNTQSNDTQT